MARNGSGTMSQSVDFTTEAASPPIEIAKLDTVLADICDEITNSIAADGQTNPSADLKMNGHRLTNLGAATALTDAARVSELIDQDHIYYVDSGSANTYVITPSPAIAAYEEGQRFVVRITNASTGASTLNVNSLGAVAIQTADASAVATGTLAAGGIYEFTYDANASPDRWVVTSPTSKIPDGMLSSNIPLKDAENLFSRSENGNSFTEFKNTSTGTAAVSLVYAENDASRAAVLAGTGSNYSGTFITGGPSGEIAAVYSSGSIPLVLGVNSNAAIVIDTSRNFDFKSGSVTTANDTADEVGFKGTPLNTQNGDYTLALTDAGKTIYKASGGAGETITIPANSGDGSVAFPVGTIVRIVNNGGGDLTVAITTDTLSRAGDGTTGSRTLGDHGVAVIEKVASTEWFISGVGIS